MKSWVKILIGLILGIIAGLIMGPKAEVLHIIGTIFIKLLTMLVMLIIFSSIVVGICHMNDPKKLGRVGLRTLAFYVITTLIAITIGYVLAIIIKPGADVVIPNMNVAFTPSQDTSLRDFFLTLIPSNPFRAFSEGNVLQVIIFSIFLGISMIFTGKKSEPLVSLLESVAATMHKLTHFVMLLAPYGVFALMASTIGTIGVEFLINLMKFLVCTYIGCFIQLFVVFPFTLRYLAKLEVIPFFKGMKDAIVLAFTTSSSSATLPVSMECTQKHLGISEDISGFVLSLGSTINMNGASIGQVVSAVFIAQLYGIKLIFLKVVLLFLISLFSAIGAAGIPGTGIIMLALVLTTVGLPPEAAGLLLGVDRLREMVSAVVNVMGDAVAAVFVAKKEKEINVDVYHKVTWMDSDI